MTWKPAPTSTAVADAVRHYRQLRELTRDELCYVLSAAGHELDVDDLRGIEDRLCAATVDDLTAIAYALEISPAEVLAHVPIDEPVSEGPAATGVPADIQHAEIRAWVRGQAQLSRAARLRWYQQLVTDLRMRSTHVEDQLRGAQAEIEELGELAVREADMPPVQRLQKRIRDGEYELRQADIALAMAEQRWEMLKGSTA